MVDTRRHKKRYTPYKKKKSYATLWILLLLGGLWYILSGKDIIPNNLSTPQVKQAPQSIAKEPTYNSLCMQANIAKILAYTLVENKILYNNIIQDEIWYNKYYDALESELSFNYLKKENALKSITYSETAELLDAILGEGYGVNIDASTTHLNKSISLNKFIEIYTNALQHTGKGITLEYMDLVIIATPANNQTLGAWKVATDVGEYGFEGLIIDPLRNNTVRAIVRNKEILCITDIISDESIIKQCYILKVEDGSVEIQVNNIKAVFENEVLNTSEEGTICNITIKGNKVISYEVQQEKNTDTLLKVTSEYIELKKAGRLTYDYIKVYDKRQGGGLNTLEQLPCGIEVEYIFKDDKVNTVQVISDQIGENIRTVLAAPGREDYRHENVLLVSEEAYDMVYNGKTTILNKEQTWDAAAFEWSKDASTISFIPKADTTMKILSLTKQGVNPKYKGIIEITKEDGAFNIVNELDIEDYVAAVIPSEMPTSYGLEATKVQAIAARTYALASKKTSRYVRYGAHVDDTTNTQVYNNVPANEISYQAAKETKGEVLLSNGSSISSKFFATSCGYTANFGEVWASGATFPTNTPIYLVSRQQYVGDKLVNNMTDEKDVYKFLTLKPSEIDAFDKDSPWFRWQTKFTGKELEALINPAIRKLSKNYPSLVKVLAADKTWEAKEIDSVGNIKDLEVNKRGQGGNIMELIIVGDKEIVKVSTEYLIRSLFSTTDQQSLNITRADTTEVKGMALLPSAFFTMDIAYTSDNYINNITLYGGGFGHGVGMSQDGVKGMATRGYTYREILRHYYPQVEIKSEAN
ncbi:SpoIID/LytB domain-containing protein [Cellulosilyticum sp. I15G10I2]|uniref:SpoIID/LytB domain-containing protein n=1 Tax=Cellulosilyticum sp. I15G10I2 TaxID=1892843 RepID=UPI00085BC9EA|nr:SpoIID/LytB domain-containing protein [Cellulosilyticum sp. I15G10I2]